ncbi:hypothetical protein NL676_026201 [Syzygium grande]|nr:hypothetical protein NL676_026201 [Syzygium grande]
MITYNEEGLVFIFFLIGELAARAQEIQNRSAPLSGGGISNSREAPRIGALGSASLSPKHPASSAAVSIEFAAFLPAFSSRFKMAKIKNTVEGTQFPATQDSLCILGSGTLKASQVRQSKKKKKQHCNAFEKKAWDQATCSVCMEYPHNAVLLLCSSYDKGERLDSGGTGTHVFQHKEKDLHA